MVSAAAIVHTRLRKPVNIVCVTFRSTERPVERDRALTCERDDDSIDHTCHGLPSRARFVGLGSLDSVAYAETD
jgi:hypothetical protein